MDFDLIIPNEKLTPCFIAGLETGAIIRILKADDTRNGAQYAVLHYNTDTLQAVAAHLGWTVSFEVGEDKNYLVATFHRRKALPPPTKSPMRIVGGTDYGEGQ